MKEQEVYISICIPAYKRIEFLKRLLDSILIQSFREYEVIISDDSPGNEVKYLADHFSQHLPVVVYHKNEEALGTPANWNAAIQRATGTWIKIMHDDDWFSTPDALDKFAAIGRKAPGAMIFSSYYDVFLSGNYEKRVSMPTFRLRQLKNEPVTLLSRNIIGPPSVVMHRNDGLHLYDHRLKWLVDIDMYIRRLQNDALVYLPEPLIKVGIGKEQVTAVVHGYAETEVPEHFYFLQKTGISRLRNLLIYDYWWRFIRNFRLFSELDIKRCGYNGPVHPVIQRMMRWERNIPVFVLKIGVLSKTIMLFHFLLYGRKIPVTI